MLFISPFFCLVVVFIDSLQSLNNSTPIKYYETGHFCNCLIKFYALDKEKNNSKLQNFDIFARLLSFREKPFLPQMFHSCFVHLDTIF